MMDLVSTIDQALAELGLLEKVIRSHQHGESPLHCLLDPRVMALHAATADLILKTVKIEVRLRHYTESAGIPGEDR
jgi:hypothetical protein